MLARILGSLKWRAALVSIALLIAEPLITGTTENPGYITPNMVENIVLAIWVAIGGQAAADLGKEKKG